MVLKGYIDESYNQRMFTMSAILASGIKWAWFESSWEKHIKAKNKTLKAKGRQQISRFHASDLSNLKGEFQGWTVEEQIDFTKGLIGVFRRFKHMFICAYSMPLDLFINEFPEAKKSLMPSCYSILLKFIMGEISDQLVAAKRKAEELGTGVRPATISLIHDRTECDGTLVDAFNKMVGDPGFESREAFCSIVPLLWRDCIPLQAADFLAYEHMKEADRRATTSSREQRKSLAALLDLPSLGGRTQRFDGDSLH